MVRTGARLGRGLVSDEAAAGGLLWLGHSDIESTVRYLKRLRSQARVLLRRGTVAASSWRLLLGLLLCLAISV